MRTTKEIASGEARTLEGPHDLVAHPRPARQAGQLGVDRLGGKPVRGGRHDHHSTRAAPRWTGQTRPVAFDLPDSPAPDSIELDREVGLTLHWPDGSEARFTLEELRVNCPCAECRGKRDQGLPAWPGPGSPQPLRAEGAELVGGWGLTIHWNDRHRTGIFAWGLLRAWANLD